MTRVERHAQARNGGGPHLLDIQEDAAPAFTLVRHSQISLGSAAVYLVDKIIPRVGVTAVWGQPKCGKTFITHDLSMHVALGWQYRGRRVKPGIVVYLAAEGATGFRARVEAFRRERLSEQDDPPFFMIDASPSLIKVHEELIRSIRIGLEEGAPVLVVIDTLNRTFEGSESSDEDMTAYVNAAHALKTAFQCAVIIVHHSGLDASRMRGHTSLLGAVDASISIKRDPADNIVMTIEAAKDGPAGEEITSRLQVVDVGTDEDGETISSCVIEPVEAQARPAQGPKPKAPTKSGKTALDAIRMAIAEVGIVPPAAEHIPPSVKCVTIEQWRTYAYQKGISASGEPRAKQQAFKRASAELIGDRHVVVWEPYAWTLKV